MKKITIIDNTVPKQMPHPIAKALALTNGHFLYKGKAKAIVAGPKNKLIN